MNRSVLSFLVILSLFAQSFTCLANDTGDEDGSPSTASIPRSSSSGSFGEADVDPNPAGSAPQTSDEELENDDWVLVDEPFKPLTKDELAKLSLEELLGYARNAGEALTDAEELKKIETAFRQYEEDVKAGKITPRGDYFIVRDVLRIVGNVASNPFVQMALSFTGVRILTDLGTFYLAPRYVAAAGSSARAMSEASLLGKIPGVAQVFGWTAQKAAEGEAWRSVGTIVGWSEKYGLLAVSATYEGGKQVWWLCTAAGYKITELLTNPTQSDVTPGDAASPSNENADPASPVEPSQPASREVHQSEE